MMNIWKPAFGEIEARGSKTAARIDGEAMGVLVQRARYRDASGSAELCKSVGMRWNLKDIGGGECMG